MLKGEARRFLTLWTLATVAAAAAFTTWLGLRVKSIELGYDLGRSHARVARLREVKRVLELEIASHETPERVDLVARTLLGMSEPSRDRIIPAGELPTVPEETPTLAARVASSPGDAAEGSVAGTRSAPPEDDAMLVDESQAPLPPPPREAWVPPEPTPVAAPASAAPSAEAAPPEPAAAPAPVAMPMQPGVIPFGEEAP